MCVKISRIILRVQEIWSKHEFCACDLWPPPMTLTSKLGVFNLCSAHGLNQVDMTIVCEIFSELDQGVNINSTHMTFDPQVRP